VITIGSMYSGYGGLDLAVAAASSLPTRVLWHSEVDPDASHVLKVHCPDVPNFGADDAQNWSAVERPDILAGGPPCQPVSAVGHRAGTADPRWRWPKFLAALVGLGPASFVFENVSRLVSYDGGALWRLILSEMRAAGYAVAWSVLGACLVGAPHHRHRLFAIGRRRTDPAPAVRAAAGELCGARGVPLLPTPMARDAHRGEGTAQFWRDRMARPDRRSKGVQLGAVVKLLYADRETDGTWGRYVLPVHHWAGLVGRSAPGPTEPTGKGGDHRLPAALSEWMQGLPEGWLTDHLDRNGALRLAGNGVVPTQGAAAIRMLWSHIPV